MKERTVLKVIFSFFLIFLQLDLIPVLAMGEKKEQGQEQTMEQTPPMKEEKTYETGSTLPSSSADRPSQTMPKQPTSSMTSPSSLDRPGEAIEEAGEDIEEDFGGAGVDGNN